MDTIPDNILPLFLDRRGQLKNSFAEFSDDQVKLCLAQLIDGLERLDELGFLVELASTDWRKPQSMENSEWEDHTSRYTSTSAVPPSGQTPWDGYQVSSKEGATVQIDELDRSGLDLALRQSWNSLDRFSVAAKLLSRDASRILGGEWIQDEGNKPEPTAKPSRSARPGR